MKPLLACSLALAVLVILPAAVDAKLKPRKFATVAQNKCAIALDAAGNPHVAYIGADYHLYHARFDGKAWQHELVDGTSDCGWGNSIAIDSQGHIHISYHAERMSPAYQPRLVYALYDGAQWHITDLDTNGYQTCLALDSSGNPHILFDSGSSTMGYAWYDDAWQFEDTGLPGSPYTPSLALDKDDQEHVTYAVNYSGHFYATKEDGTWKTTTLGGEAGDSALAVDSAGVPHIAACDGGALRYYSTDGTNWTSNVLIDASMFPGMSVLPDGVDMVLDATDRPHFLTSVYVSAGAGGVETCIYAYDDGVAWSGAPVDAKNAGFYPSLVVRPDGVVFGTYCGALKNNSAQAKYVRIALPDLSGTWSNTVFAATTFTGTLTVQNHGLDKSVTALVGFVLSDDAQFDISDVRVGTTLKLKGLKPGASASFAVNLTDLSLSAGKYLLAVIDANLETTDANLKDNMVPVLLGP